MGAVIYFAWDYDSHPNTASWHQNHSPSQQSVRDTGQQTASLSEPHTPKEQTQCRSLKAFWSTSPQEAAGLTVVLYFHVPSFQCSHNALRHVGVRGMHIASHQLWCKAATLCNPALATAGNSN